MNASEIVSYLVEIFFGCCMSYNIPTKQILPIVFVQPTLKSLKSQVYD